LQPVGDGRWQVVVGEPILTGSDAVHGGALLSTAAAAMEATTGRPVVWITGQFLSHAGPSATLDIDVDVLVDGRQTTQAAATIRVGAAEVVRAVAALGSRPFPVGDAVWATPPVDVPPPDPTTPRRLGPGPPGRIIDLHQLHVAVGRWVTELDGTPGPGRAALWSRVVGGPRVVTTPDVIVVSDFPIVPMSDALGVAVFGNSIDDTVRFVRRDVSAEWILHDVTTEAVADGFVHTTTRLWADGTTLLAVASQTMILREVGPDGQPVRRGGRRIVG
jgi:acyl-CoA thioesterase